MKCLVTGAGGFIGSQLCKALLKKGHQVIGFDHLGQHPQKWKNLSDLNIKIFNGDIGEPTDLYPLTQFHYDVIFNLAADSNTLADDPDSIYKTNVQGLRNVIALTKTNANGGILVHASSAATYGKKEGVFKETETQIPANLYGWTKKQNDIEIMSTVDIPIIGLKYFNVYGPGEELKDNMMSVIGQKINQALAGEAVTLFKGGEQRRDWIYIDDVVEMTIMAAKAKTAGVFNCGTGQASSFNDIIECIKSQLNGEYDGEVEWIDNPYEDSYQNHTQADMSQFKEHIGDHKCLTLEEGIRKYIDAKR